MTGPDFTLVQSAGVQAWRAPLAGLAVVLGVLAIAQFGTYADMVRIWTESSTFNHCFLIPALSLMLAWERRQELLALTPVPSVAGMAWLAANALLWVAGDLLGAAVLQHLAATGALIGTVWAVLGDGVLRLLRFPLFYLYFAVPEGEFLMPYLQDVTAHFSVKLLQLSGMPVYLEGRYIQIPSGTFVVAEACSGINYLIATLAVGTVFAYRAYRTWSRRLAFMVLAVIVPIVANGMRAYGIIMLAHLSDHKLAVGVDHIIYGWVFFGIVILVLFWIGGRFSDADGEGPATAAAPAAPPRTSLRHLGTAIAAAGVLVVAGPALARLSAYNVDAPATVDLPAGRSGWSGPVVAPDPLGGRWHGAALRLTGRYGRAEDEVVVDLAYYPAQGPGAELVNSLNRPYADNQMRVVARGTATAAIGGEQVTVDSHVLRDGDGSEYLVWFWYDAHGTVTNARVRAKLAYARARVVGSDQGAAAWALVTRVGTSRDAAAQVLTAFAVDVVPRLGGERTPAP